VSFRERLARHAVARRDVPALVTPATSVSYGRLAHDVDAWALALRERGIGPGAVVGLTVRAEIEHLVATLALFALGIPCVALASRDPAPARARLARLVGVTVVLADRPEDGVPGATTVGVAAVRAAAAAHGTVPTLPASYPEARTLFLTGSGTTGEPKLVAYSQRDLALHADTHVDWSGERVLRPAHVEYNNSKRMRLYTLWQGGTCLLADGATDALTTLCARLRPTWLELTPMHGADLLAAARRDGRLPPETNVRIGGSRTPYALRRALLAEVTPNLYVSYGTTETTFVSLADPTMHGADENVGPPKPGATVEVRRADGTSAAPDEPGTIRLRGPGMATAYVGDAAATARHFVDGWFVPGDIASIDTHGRLVIHGRADDMMIMNGINIFPLEIERVLEAHPAVEVAAAFPLASPIHGQIPVAAVELRGDRACSTAELLAHARDTLGVRAPRRVEIVARLPRNAQGKVMKRTLAERFAGSER
jgi:acyl-coenzyme A synthetase/AMP-(fatty) acid ligase